jgi:DnaK suppressor protein
MVQRRPIICDLEREITSFTRNLRPTFAVQARCVFIFKGVIKVTLTPQSARRYEEKLLEQKRLLEQAMLTAVEQGRETTADDTQDIAYQKELLFSQGTTGHQQLTLVRQALNRVQDGSYGECVQCGTEIGAKRLEALPWTPRCIDCQEKIENGEIEDPVRAA